MPESLPLVIQLIQDIKEVQPEEIIDPKETYTFIGFYLSTIFQYEEASQYLKKAIEYSKDDTESTAMYLDNIGFNLLRMKKFTEAEYILNKAKNLSLKTNNQNRLAKVYGNLADLNIQLNKNEEAIQLLQKDIQISRKTNQEQNTMYALILLSKAYLRTNQVVLAKKSIEEAKEIALKKDYYKSSLLQIQEIIKTIAINEKDEKLELISQRSIDQLKLDLRNFDGNETLQNSHYSNLISNLRMNQEHTKFEYERSQIANKAMGISIFLIMGISVLIFSNIKRNRKIETTEYEKHILEFKLAKVASEKKLTDAKESIESYLEFLQEKNHQIETLKFKIKTLDHSKKATKVERTSELQKLLESHLMTDENWFKFKNVFIDQYPEYYTHLQNNFTDLTESNLRLIILLKLGVGNREIPQLLGISSDAVKKAKQRLKKKLGEKYDILFETEHSI